MVINVVALSIVAACSPKWVLIAAHRCFGDKGDVEDITEGTAKPDIIALLFSEANFDAVSQPILFLLSSSTIPEITSPQEIRAEEWCSLKGTKR
jgi:hypothetical protein